jgi:hypothetical protein
MQPIKYAIPWSFILALALFGGCSTHVSQERVYGTYTARFPFGIDTIILRTDGTFSQTVVVGGSPVAVQGKWMFNPKDSRVNLYGLMVVADGFGHLRPDWQTVSPGLVSFDVEEHWFKIVMASASQFPYVRQ